MATPSFKPPSMNWEGDDLLTEFEAFKQYCNLIFDGPYSNKNAKERAAYVLIWIGRTGIETYNTFTWEDEADKKKPDKIFEQFEFYLAPKINKWMFRLQLQDTKQSKSESFDDFVKRCRLQTSKCKFKSAEETEERLIEQIIYGVQHLMIRERILEKGDDINLNTVMEIGRTYEATSSHMEKLKGTNLEVDTIKNSLKPSNKNSNCNNCGGDHERRAESCPAYGEMCYHCNNYNHYAKFCKSKNRARQHNRNHTRQSRDHSTRYARSQSRKRQGTHKQLTRSNGRPDKPQQYHSVNTEDEFESLTFSSINIQVNAVKEQNEAIIQIKIQRIETRQDLLETKLDTGAQGDILPLRIYKDMYPQNIDDDGKPKPGALQKSHARLTAYGGTPIIHYGIHNLKCEYNGVKLSVPFHVTEPEGPDKTSLIENKDDLLNQYPESFNGIGTFEGQYHITLDPDIPPIIHAPRRVAIVLKEKIKQELDNMVEQQIIAPVREGEPTAWVNSLVFKRKPSGKLRICLDPKDLNRAIRRDHHVVPTLAEILPKLSGAKYFSIVDAKCGYWNVELDKESSYLTTFNSPHGRYRFLRMPFGLKMSQDVFQSKIDQTFEGCPGVIGIADDIVCFGKTEEEHSYNLHMMMKRCAAAGIKLNPDKCQIKKEQIKFYGVVCSKHGIQPDPAKVSALKNMKAPTNTKEVQTFLGIVTYMGSFIPNLSNLTAPLRDFTKKNTFFKWSASHQTAFEDIKNAISENTTLTYFNPSKPITLQVDASIRGLGATIIQDNRPVAFASKALTETEARYANIERELLAVVFGCEKFHTYLYGQTFDVETDHKPLESIQLKHLVAAPPRLQRMLLRLQPYDIKIVYKPGREIPIADALSRLSPVEEGPIEDMDVQIHSIIPNFTNDMISRIKYETDKDQELIVLKEIIYNGWPTLIKQVPQSIKPYWTYRDELSIEEGVLLKGQRLIIPKTLQPRILQKLHEAHQGIEKTKLRARTSIFWRNLNYDIENMVKECQICMKYAPSQQKEPMIPSDIPPRPWHTIGTDLFHLNGNDYLLLADYYSKFPFVRKLPANNSSSVIVTEIMQQIFSEHGIPKVVRSDNGPQYDGKPFRDMTEAYGIQHITSSPLYPKSNGFIESQVKLVKRTLQKAKDTNTDPNIALLCLRATPIDSRLDSPATLLYNRQIQDNLPRKKFLEDNDQVRTALQDRQSVQKLQHDHHSQDLPPLVPGQKVGIQNQRTKLWEPAIVHKTVQGVPRSYTVKTGKDLTLRRNRSQLKDVPQQKTVHFDLGIQGVPTISSNSNATDSDRLTYVTRSGRISKPPERLDF